MIMVVTSAIAMAIGSRDGFDILLQCCCNSLVHVADDCDADDDDDDVECAKRTNIWCRS